ncbi:MAG: hypothetical protein IJ607_11040 [Bacteroidaceae bacterium]|nr:hypothetical protein [Bacteroidaceae bacterium]
MIPDFDHNNVLPPYIGNAVNPKNMSPYPCDILEFCQHFATSQARIAILKGYVHFRLSCVANGITGSQWIDGSFVENVEVSESRDPHDVDVVTLMKLTPGFNEQQLLAAFPEFANHKLSLQNYKVDHYPFIINLTPELTIQQSKYWNLLFGHNRRGVWKGMLEIPLYDNSAYDQMALNFLDTL